MVGSFYGFLTLHEILRVVFREDVENGFMVILASTGEVLMNEEEASRILHSSSRHLDRLFIVCKPTTIESLKSINPPMSIMIDVPTERQNRLEQTWMSYKLSDEDCITECGEALISFFKSSVKRFKKHLRGHVMGYFDYDKSAKSEYKRIRYSTGAFDMLHTGVEWRDGSVIFEPAALS